MRGISRWLMNVEGYHVRTGCCPDATCKLAVGNRPADKITSSAVTPTVVRERACREDDEHGHRRTLLAWPWERFVRQFWHGLYFDGRCR
jgi:hypothetical protein